VITSEAVSTHVILIFTHTPGEDQLGPMWRHIYYGFGNGCQLKQLKKTANGGVLGRHAAPRLTKPRSPDSNFFGTPPLVEVTLSVRSVFWHRLLSRL